METLANLSSSPKQSTANSKCFCWQTLFCSIKFFPIRNLLPQRPGKKGLESSMNIVKWRLHFALGPEGTIRSSHLTPALKKEKKQAHTTIEQHKKNPRIAPTHVCTQSAKSVQLANIFHKVIPLPLIIKKWRLYSAVSVISIF